MYGPHTASRGRLSNSTADYVFMLLFCTAVMLPIIWYMQMPLVGSMLVMSVLYVWSRRHPDAETSIWGFRLKAIHLPWGILAFHVILGDSPIPDVIGIVVGHLYYFLVVIMPATRNGKRLLWTPEWLVLLFDRFFYTTARLPAGQDVRAQRPPGHGWGGAGRVLGAN